MYRITHVCAPAPHTQADRPTLTATDRPVGMACDHKLYTDKMRGAADWLGQQVSIHSAVELRTTTAGPHQMLKGRQVSLLCLL